jgi:hypothetical protein|tara:strand:- start:923 stop:1027 length:105 start_codon:yes stop_codon:yes gene_type:complete
VPPQLLGPMMEEVNPVFFGDNWGIIIFEAVKKKP